MTQQEGEEKEKKYFPFPPPPLWKGCSIEEVRKRYIVCTTVEIGPTGGSGGGAADNDSAQRAHRRKRALSDFLDRST